MVYDPERNQAHSLNRTALAIWNQCDGRNSILDLQRLVGAELGVPIDETAIRLGLRKLLAAHLLVEMRQPVDPVTRRDLLRSAGQLGALAVATPLIASAFIPAAAAAASLPVCRHDLDDDDDDHYDDDEDVDLNCSRLDESCVCSITRAGNHICIDHSTALKHTTCLQDHDCPTGFFCIPSGAAPPRCIGPCRVATCRCT